MSNTLPFAVTEFSNASGSRSFRVSGYWKGVRTRKNFQHRALADAFCNAKNADALNAPAPTAWLVVQTKLTEQEVRAAESAVEQINKRWTLRDVLRAGIAAMESKIPSTEVAPLAEEWLMLIEHEVSARWYSDLKHRVTYFVAAHPKLTTDRLDRSVVRSWLDGLPLFFCGSTCLFTVTPYVLSILAGAASLCVTGLNTRSFVTSWMDIFSGSAVSASTNAQKYSFRSML